MNETPSWIPAPFDQDYFFAPGEVVVVAAIGVPGFANLPDYSSLTETSVLVAENGVLTWSSIACGEAGVPALENLTDVTFLDLQVNQIIYWDGTQWRNTYIETLFTGATSLDELSDVNAPSPQVGQALVFDGSAWVPQDVAVLDGNGLIPDNLVPKELPDYSQTPDYSVLTVLNNDLVWNQISSGNGGATFFNDLLDVNISGPANGDLVVYQSGSWQNVPSPPLVDGGQW